LGGDVTEWNGTEEKNSFTQLLIKVDVHTLTTDMEYIACSCVGRN